MWTLKRIIIFSIPFVLVLLAVLSTILLRNTLRTRMHMEKQLRDDPDINEWLVIFDWSRKILYFPTILLSLLFAGLMFLQQSGLATCVNPYILGGVWLAVFVLNFMVDEYEISMKVLLIVILCLLVLGLWLTLLDWLVPFLELFGRLRIYINGTVYLLLAGLFLLAIGISWLKGLFYYVAITPNFINFQNGPTETSEQIGREHTSTRIDTGDFLERLLGFGRIVITFTDNRRPPIMLLVDRIGRRATKLESIRGTMVVDRFVASREGQETEKSDG